MKTKFELNKNLIVNYENGRLYCVEKLLDKIEIRIHESGDIFYRKNGVFHRDGDLPAIEYVDGEKRWCYNGKLHRDNGLPAKIYVDGHVEYWENGKFIRQK